MVRENIVARDLITPVGDLVHRVRHLGFFEDHLASGIRSISAQYGIHAQVDDAAAQKAFFSWIRLLNAQRELADTNRRDYIAFGGGLLLTKLLEHRVISAQQSGNEAHADRQSPIGFWPEGYLAVTYCMTVLDIVLEQEGFQSFTPSAAMKDLRQWWSMRENCMEDPALALPFFDLMIGNQPNWNAPLFADKRPAIHERLTHSGAEGGDRAHLARRDQ